jgi:hypothetical protein
MNSADAVTNPFDPEVVEDFHRHFAEDTALVAEVAQVLADTFNRARAEPLRGVPAGQVGARYVEEAKFAACLADGDPRRDIAAWWWIEVTRGVAERACEPDGPTLRLISTE